MFTIRDATSTDLSQVRDIYRRSSLSNPGDRAVLLANPDVLEFWSPALEEGRTRVVVTDDGRVIAFATPIISDDFVEIEDLFVDPEWMRKGIGRGLVDDIITTARANEIPLVEVTANPHALAFYEQVGFVIVGEAETQFAKVPRMRLKVN